MSELFHSPAVTTTPRLAKDDKDSYLSMLDIRSSDALTDPEPRVVILAVAPERFR